MKSGLIYLMLCLLFAGIPIMSEAQVKNTDGSILTIDPNSILELESTNKGLLIPGVAINDNNLAIPLTAPVTEGMLVFNGRGSVNDGFCYWNSSSGWTRKNIDNALYFLKTNSTDQYGGTYSTYMEGISSDGVANNIIPSMQGFFIHVTDGGWQVTSTIAMNNNASIVNTPHLFSKSGEEGVIPIVRIVAGYSGDSLSYDPFVIYYDDKATYNFDGQFDAFKIYNSDRNVTNFYVFGSDGSKLSIDGIPINTDSLCTLRLGLKTEKDGEIIIKIKDITGIFLEETIFLHDVITGLNQNLVPEGVYKLYLPAGDYQNRFYLNLADQATAIPEIPSVNDRIKIYSSHGTVKVEINLPEYKNGILTMCNLTGQVLFKQNIYNSGFFEIHPMVKDGVYIISLIYHNMRISKKIVLQN